MQVKILASEIQVLYTQISHLQKFRLIVERHHIFREPSAHGFQLRDVLCGPHFIIFYSYRGS
jgi:hypothetical protein